VTVLAFYVRGLPKAQPRPRAFARKMGGKVVARVFEAGTAEAWKADVIRCGEPHRPESPIEGPVSVEIDFMLPRPKRLMRRKDPDGVMWATCKPDVDNLSKAVLDALTTDGWWRDDAQVVESTTRKVYHAKDGTPGALVCIEQIESGGVTRPREAAPALSG